MKKILLALGLSVMLVLSAFADETLDPDVEAQNDAIAAEQEAAQDAESSDVTADVVAEGESETDAEAEATAEQDNSAENTAVADNDDAQTEDNQAEDTQSDSEAVAQGEGETDSENAAVAEAQNEPAQADEDIAVAEEDQPAEESDSEEINAGVAAAAADIKSAASGVAEEQLNALIASFPQGTWIDNKYNAAWVFGDDGTLEVQNARTGKVYFKFSLNKINSYSVVPTADGIAVSFVCGETKRQYTFVKSNADDYNMTLKIQCGWIEGGYTAVMSKKQNVNVNKN